MRPFPIATVRVLIALLVAVPGLVGPGRASAQSGVEDAIKQLTGENAKGYFQPMGDLLGADLNAGFFRSAAVQKRGFHLSFDIIAMGALVGDDQKTYMATAPAGFSPATFKTATIFGGTGTIVQDTGFPWASYRGSDGVFNTSIMPAAVPQITFGSVYGTDAIIRLVATPKIGEDIPSGVLWSLGARHSISQYFPTLLFDVAVAGVYSKMKVGDYIDFGGLIIGAHASKQFSVVTLYGGLAWEKSTVNLSYRSANPSEPVDVDIDLDGANSVRFMAGFQLTFGVFHLFADANLGSVTHFSGGFGFGN